MSKNTAAKTKASSKDKTVMSHDGNILLTEKNTQHGLLNTYQTVSEEIWALCPGG